jgi:hypothetical protein
MYIEAVIDIERLVFPRTFRTLDLVEFSVKERPQTDDVRSAVLAYSSRVTSSRIAFP